MNNTPQTDNEFLRYRSKTEEAVRIYQALRKKYSPQAEGFSKSVEVLARPFLKGHFTLAVIGEMSAGKSTFINALLEKELLATGFGQTTCTLTEIEHADQECYEVEFADGSRKKYSSIKELQEHMAIPDEYRELPIKQINDYIVRGLKVQEIVARKEKLEGFNKGNIEEKILRKYVSEHNKRNIPRRVYVHTPLSEDYRGWRIIDTPGLAASGGIEEETYNLLESKDEIGKNNIIDAVIFVNSAKRQAEGKTFVEVVENTIGALPDEVRRRLFLVRTHGTDRDYRRNEAEEQKAIERLFVNRLRINAKHICVVDSLVHIFQCYANAYELDLINMRKDAPSEWLDAKTWKAARDIVRDAKGELEDDNKEVNAETIKGKLKQWANFEGLQMLLNDFAREEKSKTYESLIRKILEELLSMKHLLRKKRLILIKSRGNLKLLRDNMTAEGVKLEKAINEVNSILRAIRAEYGRKKINERFKGIIQNVKNLKGDSVGVMKDQLRRHSSEVDTQKEQLMTDLAASLGDILKEELKKVEIVMSPIDFAAIEVRATKVATKEVEETRTCQVKQQGLWGSLKRMISFDVWGYDEQVYTVTKTQLDEEEQKRQFRDQAVTAFISALDALKKQLGEEVDLYGAKAQKKLEEGVEQTKAEYQNLCNECQSQEALEAQIKQLDAQVEEVETGINQLDKLK